MNNIVFAVLFVFLLLPQYCWAQKGLNAAPVIPNLAWTASSGPYIEAKDKIKNLYAEGKNPQSLLDEYQKAAIAHPKDPVAQFAWICAGRGAAWLNSSEGSMPRYLLDTLAKSDPGNVREYTRYRFCMTDETDLVLPIQNADLIGGRLLASNPKDGWVRLSLINMLCATPGGTAKALPHALNWVQIEPNNAKAHSSLAQVYFEQWEESKRRSLALGKKSISEYQNYLRLAAPDDGFRRHAQSFIKYIQHEQVQQG